MKTKLITIVSMGITMLICILPTPFLKATNQYHVNIEEPIIDSPGLPKLKNIKGWFLLKTESRGKSGCLEGNQASSFVYNGAAFITTCRAKSTGQFWKIEPVDNGFYRLKTKFRGRDECLDCNKRSSMHNGAAFMGECKNVKSQLWKIEPVANGYFRLKTSFHGEEKCLEANGLAVRGPAAQMASCKNVDGQFWKLESVK